MSNRPDVKFIAPPNTLMKAKIGLGQVKPDTQAIQRGEAAIRKIGDDFPQWAQDDLDEMDKALAAARQNPDQQEDYIMQIFERSMELKGQGGSFGCVGASVWCYAMVKRTLRGHLQAAGLSSGRLLYDRHTERTLHRSCECASRARPTYPSILSSMTCRLW